MTERDYVLGTHDAEIERLGLQHRVWRPTVLDCWQRAGIGPGCRVLDVGAGPGWATVDLAEIVGPSGEVIAVERSARFLQAAQAVCEMRGLRHVRLHDADLMTDAIPAENMDYAWCRWVASFVSSPDILAQKIAAALKPGGLAIFHEYAAYDSFRILPAAEWLTQLKKHVVESWRANGGEPDVAGEVVRSLADAGLRLREAKPLVFCLRPSDPMWQWPATFIETHMPRLVELGYSDSERAEATLQQFRQAESAPNTLLITPMVLEIIAERS